SGAVYPGTETVGLDVLSNRTLYQDTRRGANFSTSYGATNGANEYSTIGGLSTAYDPTGNVVTTERGYRLGYDFENKLARVCAPNVPVCDSAPTTPRNIR